ncbi:MAG TPA: glycosyl transferase family 1, partial [Chloroflexi bacterium]|nr:glycosyl transferase family 1 [Chloroflexota bacterium]
RDLLVAETPAGLAEAVLSLLADEARRRQMGRAARRYVETHHDWNAVAARLGAIYREVVTER